MEVEKLNNISKIKVLVFGDYMLDKYVNGNVSRISPEAPVPVLEVKNISQKLGGAGNVINNIISLGGKVRILGCVGDDEAGQIIFDYFSNDHIDITFFKKYRQISSILKTRVVSKNQQFLRIDDEKKEPLLLNYFNFIQKNINKIFKDINVLVISDYAKGAVTKEVSQLLIKEAKKREIPIIVDPKGKDYSKYAGATICTPNVKEISEVLNIKIETEKDIETGARDLCKKNNLEYLAVTRSEKGISVVDKQGLKKDYPAKAKEVIDVSGAGDTVVATVSLLMGIKYPVDDIWQVANMAASVVVSKFGTATVSLNELICSVNETGEFKLKDVATLKYLIQALKEKGKKIVFTNGCYDLLHYGHISSFEQAKKYGDILIVAVNSDRSVKVNKGNLRPIIPEEDRLNMIMALDIVDYVILMDDKDPSSLINALKPDVCIKGSDWKDKKTSEAKIIKSYGGKQEFIDLEKGRSTTIIIDKILKAYGKNE